MVTTPRLLLAVTVAAIAVLITAAIVTKPRTTLYRQQASNRSPVAGSATRLAARAEQIARADATQRRPAELGTPTKQSAHPAPQRTTAPRTTAPSSDGAFTLVVKAGIGDIVANVDPISVASNQPVDPPHATTEQWNTAVWVQQSSYPSVPSKGTTYVYGHACHYHICPFTRLKDAGVDDQVVVTTSSGPLVYRIGRIGLSPKDASSLPSWASDSSVPNRLVLVTCAFEQNDISRENIVVVAQLQAA